MTINLSDNNPRANYTATSGQTAFTIPFDYFDDGDISVYQNGTLKTITTHYTISGSTVTLVTGATAGDKIAITRDVPLERTTDLTSTYNAASINNQLDTIVAQIADLDDRVSRSISLNDYEVGVSLDLPATADRLGKTIQFNSSTGALEVGPSGDELTSIASIASEITALDGISSNITSVAGYLTEINNVGDNIASVTSVSGSISSVGTVSTNIADVNLVAGSITDLNDVADSLDQVELVATSISNVDIVGPAIANVNTVAGNITNINTVSGISSNITTVAGITAAISTVNSNAADITSVSNNIDDVNDVANVITKVTTVADNIANVNTVAPAVTYVSTLANNISNINLLAPISADITAAAAVASDIGDAATNAAAAISAKTAAESARDATLAAFDSFDDRYLGAKAADPSVDNDGNALVGGALYYNTTDEVMKVYTGSAWVAAYASLSGALLVANNLSDLANAASARTNLGLGTAATTASTDYVAVTGDSMTGNLTFGDNDKAIFGAGSDLQIYHDGSHSRLSEVGTGSLLIDGDEIYLRSSTGENKIIADTNGGVNLFYDNSSKLATTSTGIDVTGTVTADGLTVDKGSAGTLATFTDGVNSNFVVETASLITTVGNTGGSTALAFKSANTERMRIDSNGNVGIGTTSPSTLFHIDAASDGRVARFGSGTSDTGGMYVTHNSGSTRSFELSADNILILDADRANGRGSSRLQFNVDGTERMRIDSSGNVRLTQNFYTPDYGYIGNSAGTYSGINTGLQTLSGGSGYLLTYVNGSERMRIDSSGNVGIGTSSPNNKLTIEGSATLNPYYATYLANSYYDTSWKYAGNGIAWGIGNNFGGVTNGTTIAVASSNSSGSGAALTWNPAFNIDSSGKVGIGTSSPSGSLAAGGLHVTDRIAVGAGSTGTPALHYDADTDTGIFFGTGVVAVSTGGTERMRIDSSGNVGIGTTSPNASLSVTKQNSVLSGTGNSYGIHLYPTSSGQTFIDAITNSSGSTDLALRTYNNATYNELIKSSSGGTTTTFQTSGAERMRIDSSGNLLVGKTSTTFGSVGARLSSTDNHFTTNGGAVADFNRLTSDGSIVNFYKDGTTVGSIGSVSDKIYIGSSAGGDTFLRLNSNTVAPASSSGADRDATINLGYSGARFQNLLLSGGVYLGGTGSANKLDDYEEGTWTPNVGGVAVGGAATYIKIGEFVHINIDITAAGGISATNQITNLPFTVKTGYHSAFAVGYTNSGIEGGYFDAGTTIMKCIVAGNTTPDNINAGERLILFGTYRTNA